MAEVCENLDFSLHHDPLELGWTRRKVSWEGHEFYSCRQISLTESALQRLRAPSGAGQNSAGCGTTRKSCPSQDASQEIHSPLTRCRTKRSIVVSWEFW